MILIGAITMPDENFGPDGEHYWVAHDRPAQQQQLLSGK